MNKYIIAIDGGATKSVARIIHFDAINQEVLLELSQGGCSLSQDFEQALANISQLLIDLMQSVNADKTQVYIVMGLAGAGSNKLKQRFIDELHHVFSITKEQIFITTDALTSLLGANNGKPANCLALGTGSVAMSLDYDGNFRQFGGWGADIADEGGAVFIGKQAVRAILWEYDEFEKFHSKLSIKLTDFLGTHRNQLLHWLRQAKPIDYANLASLVTELKDNCLIAKKVFNEHINQVELLAQTALKSNTAPLFILGGLADITSPYLSRSLQDKLLLPQGNSVDGACLLAYCQLTGKQEFTL
jgi:glucosamine kinase